MNLSNIVTRVKLKLGLLNIATPFEDLDGTIIKIMQDITIPVFSLYQPCKETMYFKTNELERIAKEDQSETFLLPEFKGKVLLNVIDVTYDDTSLSGLGYYGGGMPLTTGNLIQQAMLANAGAAMTSLIYPKMTFHYEHPRKLTIYNAWSSAKLRMDLAFEHDKSLASIPETARESFVKLLMLDVKENLYPTLKQYNQISSAYGNIDLKLDDWANAESERQELINQWDETYHLDLQPMYFY